MPLLMSKFSSDIEQKFAIRSRQTFGYEWLQCSQEISRGYFANGLKALFIRNMDMRAQVMGRKTQANY